MLTILGLEPDVQREWFDLLAADGEVLDVLQRRPWGDYDGQVVDRFGLRWLIGFKGDSPGSDHGSWLEELDDTETSSNGSLSASRTSEAPNRAPAAAR